MRPGSPLLEQDGLAYRWVQKGDGALPLDPKGYGAEMATHGMNGYGGPIPMTACNIHSSVVVSSRHVSYSTCLPAVDVDACESLVLEPWVPKEHDGDQQQWEVCNATRRQDSLGGEL